MANDDSTYQKEKAEMQMILNKYIPGDSIYKTQLQATIDTAFPGRINRDTQRLLRGIKARVDRETAVSGFVPDFVPDTIKRMIADVGADILEIVD